MRDVMTRIAPAVGLFSGCIRVQRLADGAIADGVNVDLEAFAIEARDEPGQAVRLEIEFAPAAGSVEIWFQKRRGSGLDYAICEDFYCRGPHSFAGEPGPSFHQADYLLLAFLRIGP